jgi:hypothetical protein
MTTKTVKAPQANRTILDFAELAEACYTRRRLAKQTPASLWAIDHAGDDDAYCAQIDERVVAVAHRLRIALMYAKTPAGCDIADGTRLHDWVSVYPAARGRTTYKIDDAVHGWFANKWLPLLASERNGQSGYEHPHWYHGQSGVYQKGMGPYYEDTGPEYMQLGSEGVLKLLSVAPPYLPEAWRDDARSLLRRVQEAVSPFRDVLLRYEVHGWDAHTVEDDSEIRLGAFTIAGSTRKGWVDIRAWSPYGLRIRLKSPCVFTGARVDTVPDLVVSISGPLNMIDGGADTNYGVELMYSNSDSRYRYDDHWDTNVPFVITRTAGKAVEAARQWAANRVYIPCE